MEQKTKPIEKKFKWKFLMFFFPILILLSGMGIAISLIVIKDTPVLPLQTHTKSNAPAKWGDIVNINYVGEIRNENGSMETFEGGTAENQTLELGSGAYISGFETGLIGAKVGEEVILRLVFPEKYKADLANKFVVFTVFINAIETKKES